MLADSVGLAIPFDHAIGLEICLLPLKAHLESDEARDQASRCVVNSVHLLAFPSFNDLVIIAYFKVFLKV